MKRYLLSIIAFLAIVTIANAQIEQADDLNSGISLKNAATLGTVRPLQSLNVLKSTTEWSTPEIISIDGTEALSSIYRVFRDGIPSTFAVPKVFPGNYGPATSYQFSTVTITPTSSMMSIKYTYESGDPLFLAAYQDNFDPSDLSLNYLGDTGTSPSGVGSSNTMEINIPAGSKLILVFMNVSPNTMGTVSYEISPPSAPMPPLPKISMQPINGTICEGGDYTFKVEATGDNLTYQWYKGNNSIIGANTNTLKIEKATKLNYETYYVVVKGDGGSISSDKVVLWVTDQLPSTLTFAECPTQVITGQTYNVKLAGYIDVTKYTWSFSSAGATFNPVSGKENETMVTFGKSTPAGTGTLTVTVEHPCGVRTATQNISVAYPTGIDDLGSSQVKIYPNPVVDLLTIDNGSTQIESIIVSDLNGRIVYQGAPNASSSQILATKWTKGIYFVKITTQSANSSTVNTKVYKVIKN